MDGTEATVRNILSVIEAPLYDLGVLSERGMLPGLHAIPAATVLAKLSLLKYRNARGSHIYIRPSGENGYTRLDDLSHGLFPFVRLKNHTGEQYPMAEAFVQEITQFYEARQQEREVRRLQASLSPQRGLRLSSLSLERLRTSTKYHDRPAAADIAFCVAAYANGMDVGKIEHSLEDDYLSHDPSPSKRASYVRRT